jgi:hypothetical protein
MGTHAIAESRRRVDTPPLGSIHPLEHRCVAVLAKLCEECDGELVQRQLLQELDLVFVLVRASTATPRDTACGSARRGVSSTRPWLSLTLAACGRDRGTQGRCRHSEEPSRVRSRLPSSSAAVEPVVQKQRVVRGETRQDEQNRAKQRRAQQRRAQHSTAQHGTVRPQTWSAIRGS